jgi:hypothetical protein
MQMVTVENYLCQKGHGVTRVTHVLNAAKTRVLTFEQLCTRYPNLVGRGATRTCVKRMFGSIRTNLHRWQHTLAGGPQPGIYNKASSGTRRQASSYAPGRQPKRATPRCRPGPA